MHELPLTVVKVDLEDSPFSPQIAMLTAGRPYLFRVHDHMGSVQKLHVSAHPITRPPAGQWLRDARGVVRLHMRPDEGFYEYSMVPSMRTLAEVFADAVQHGEEYPRHGTDCTCMDNLIRELRVHVYRATPPVDKVRQPDYGPGEYTYNQEQLHNRWSAQARMRHILRVLMDGL